MESQELICKFLLQLDRVLPDKLKKAGEEQDHQVLIRMDDYKIYKFESRQKSQPRNTPQTTMYLDPIDAEMLTLRHEAATHLNSSHSPKWLNLCWDAFRIVDNHSKSHIF